MFSDIHSFFKKVIEEVETKGGAELTALASDVRTAIANEKNDILAQVQSSSPDIQAAVQHALSLMEQAILAAITARLGA